MSSQVVFGQLRCRADQRLVLRPAQPRLRDHRRPAGHHQRRARHVLYARRVRLMDAAQLPRHWLLVGADPVAAWAPRIVGMALEKTLISRVYHLDHIYGLLLTYGLMMFIMGAFIWIFATAGRPYPVPAELRGGFDLGFMFLPKYRAWVVLMALIFCFGTWYAIEKTPIGRTLRAATENPKPDPRFRHQRTGPADVRIRCRCRARRFRRRHGGADLFGQPADGRRPRDRDFCRRRRRRHGLDPRRRSSRRSRSACSKASPRWSIRRARTW